VLKSLITRQLAEIENRGSFDHSNAPNYGAAPARDQFLARVKTSQCPDCLLLVTASTSARVHFFRSGDFSMIWKTSNRFARSRSMAWDVQNRVLSSFARNSNRRQFCLTGKRSCTGTFSASAKKRSCLSVTKTVRFSIFETLVRLMS